RIENQLSGIGRQFISVTKDKNSANRRAFATLARELKCDLQQPRQVTAYRHVTIVPLQPWVIPCWLGDNKRVQAVGASHARKPENPLVQTDQSIQGRQK